MKPLNLTMQAFGSYGEVTKIDFTEPNQNLFLISGDTGAGKTTIFDAIVFAIYGEASSGNNRKDGTELQSQYVEYGMEPFVELVFSEIDGAETLIYTVRRVPRHIRPLKKGTGMKEEKETVSLIMPDGREFSQNQKETDRKLEEIVGLTKSQFMQVAMIAQGEFMELLRAKSENKKVIFRKLFHTELFQEIVEELGQRRKEKLTEIARIRTVCQTETGHVTVPADYENGDRLRDIRQRILTSERLNITDMEALLEELKLLCDWLEEKRDNGQKEYETAGRIRDEKRDACTSAENLLRFFEQLERAEKELSECREKEEQRKEAESLISRIHGAYEVKAVYDRFADSQAESAETEKSLKQQKAVLPGLTEADEKAAAAEREAKKAQDAGLEAYTKVSERVEKSLEIWKKIRNARKDMEKKGADLVSAEEETGRAQKALKDFEAQEQDWKKQEEELRDADMLLELWKKKCGEAEGMILELNSVRKAQRDVAAQKNKVNETQNVYAAARMEYGEKNAEYLEKQEAYLDAQAGFLAKEKLRPGVPCPVCGSLEHPQPCRLSESHQKLTREMIGELAKEVSGLQQKQTKASAAAGAALDLLQEKENNFKKELTRLRERMEKCIPDVPEVLTLEHAEALIAAWQKELEKEGVVCQEKAEILADIRDSLKGSDKQRQALQDSAVLAAEKAADAKTALAAVQALLKELEAQKDYPTEQEARAVLADAAKRKKMLDLEYDLAYRTAREAKTAKENVRVLLERYERELPFRKEENVRRKAAYEQVMTEKNLSKREWKDICEKHKKSETFLLQEWINDYDKKKASAEGARTAAVKAVHGRQKPVLEKLEAARDEAQSRFSELQAILEQRKEDYKANRGAYLDLAPKMQERSRITQEYTRLDSLYNRLSGKVSGARMDIETFVQRYYLQRILYAANIRFQDMSAGQFELRMVGEEEAGEGRNRGLDLLVYSTVTGKEREVRTLSGGESFMAALSLALGMADQIQECSASIHLDMMFIDEGFGSLDEHSRDQAVRVLQQMAGGSKLIGIISHVTELKQEIEDQLLVSKDENGSHVRWQIS